MSMLEPPPTSSPPPPTLAPSRPHLPAPIPRVSPTLFRFVSWYFTRQLKRSFHQVRLLNSSRIPALSTPTVFFLNHPSWWDPVLCFHLANRFYPARKHFAPIDAEALKKYKFLAKLGLFGIEKHSRAGAATFLRTASSILHENSHTLWITAEGDFTDPRTRPTTLRPGIGHLAKRLPSASFIPLALEYTFWQERHPELLLAIGDPISLSPDTDPASKTNTLSIALEHLQNQLAQASIQRNPALFQTLLQGRGGVHPVYDLWRRFLATTRGESFSPSHSHKDSQ